MPMQWQTAEMLSNTKVEIEKMQSFDASTFVHANASSKEILFDSVARPANALIALYKRIDVSGLNVLPDAMLKPVWEHCKQDYSLLEQIQDITTQAMSEKDQVRLDIKVEDLIERYAITAAKLQSVIALSPALDANVARLIDAAKGTLDNTINGVKEKVTTFEGKLNEAKEEMQEKMEEKVQELRGIVAAAQSTLSKAGVTKQAAYFNTTCKNHKDDARTWLGVTCVSFLPLLLFSCFVFLNGTTELSPGQSLPLSPTPSEVVLLIGSRVLLFAVLSSLVVVASRNYFAHRHNAVVNEHRTNALNTYQVLARATDDDLERDKILTMAASAIFSPQSSGYGKEGLSKAPAASSIVELALKPPGEAQG